jgi:hypothetical protein
VVQGLESRPPLALVDGALESFLMVRDPECGAFLDESVAIAPRFQGLGGCAPFATSTSKFLATKGVGVKHSFGRDRTGVSTIGALGAISGTLLSAYSRLRTLRVILRQEYLWTAGFSAWLLLRP